MKTNVLYCPSPLPKKDKVWVFLMGPIQGAPNWQEEVADLCKDVEEDILFLNPRRLNNPTGNEDKLFSDTVYKMQVEWETKGLRLADIIFCWIPPSTEDIPGRSYAQTTRFELGENLARGKTVIAGTYPEFPGRRYFQQKLSSYHQIPLQNQLQSLISILKTRVGGMKKSPKVWFTSDTHFGSERALQYSYRYKVFKDVKDMDQRMMENWNSVISPWDTVYHLGDFGNLDTLKYLNGKEKILIPGNYEDESRIQSRYSWIDYAQYLKERGWSEVKSFPEAITIPFSNTPFLHLWASHFPTEVKKEVIGDRELGLGNTFGIFGHIHGRQKIKPWGMDVGVDANNFFPISLDYIGEIFTVIKQGYYDKEVWC